MLPLSRGRGAPAQPASKKPQIIFSLRRHQQGRALQADDGAITAVLDTNIALDWLVFRDAGVAALVQAIESRRLRILSCARMRDELAHVLERGSLARWRHDAGAALATYNRWIQRCDEPPPCRLACRDADDQVFIDLAHAERCRWLVTHDRALLALARPARAHGLQIVRPTGWQPD